MLSSVEPCGLRGFLRSWFTAYLTPTVNDTETLRPAISVRMSPGAAALDFADAALTAVMAWLSVRLLTASRMRDCDSRDDPRSV